MAQDSSMSRPSSRGRWDSTRQYLEAQRTGRRTGLNDRQREKVFEVYWAYMTHLREPDKQDEKVKRIDYDDIGNQIINICELYKCKPIGSRLVVDEAQDLAKTWIDALRRTVSGKIVFAGDPSQSIHGRGFTWRDVAGKREYPLRARFRRIPDFGLRRGNPCFHMVASAGKDAYRSSSGMALSMPTHIIRRYLVSPACFRLASVSTQSGQQVLLRYLHIPYNQKS